MSNSSMGAPISTKTTNLNSDIVCKNEAGKIFTTSLLIAENFHKQHGTVLRKIKKIPNDNFKQRNFTAVQYKDETVEEKLIYEITRDGFSYIAMSFTNEEAHKPKIKFIDAFNKMESHLRNLMKKGWFKERAEAALEHRQMCRILEEVRQLDGKTTRHYHYANETKLVNWTITGEYKKLDREFLNKDELRVLNRLQSLNAVLIGVGYNRDTRKKRLKVRYQKLVNLLVSDEKP